MGKGAVFSVLCLASALLLNGASALAACQGFGAQTPGGEGKPVYLVTNLQDSGPGSLRDAVSQSNRMITFAVGGVINLASDITITRSFLTIDGMSAPAPGITLQHKGLIIRGSGGHDVRITGIRIRNASQDGMWITDAAYNVVIDHVSIHGSGDGNLDITRLNTRNISVCYSILAEPAGEEKNSLLAHSTRMSFHHNLFVASPQRNPQVTYDDTSARTQDTNTTFDMRHNLIWDWGGTYGTRIRYGGKANVVNNCYSSSDDALIICHGTGSVSECDGDATNIARAYVSGNHNAANSLGTESIPFAAPPITLHTAQQAACRVVHEAGVRPVDSTDQHYLAMIDLPDCDASTPPPSDELWLVKAGGGA